MAWACRFSWCLVVALLGTSPLVAADWPVPRGPSREPHPFRYDPALWKKVPAEFLDDAPACILYAASTYLVENDGTVETIVHDVTLLNSRKSIEKLGEYRHVSFNPAHEKPTLNVARIHKKNGTTVAVEPRHLHLRDVGTDYLVYNPDKQLVISFPSLEVGDVIEVKWTVRGKNPEHHGQFFTRYSFGDTHYPIVRDEVRVRVPKSWPFHHAVVGGKAALTVEDTAEGRLHRWSSTNCPPLPRDEDAPTKEDLRVQVACSTFTSWEAVGQWKRQVRASCWDCTKEIKQVVADVTRGLTDPREKARALTYWVRRNIRYLSAGLKHDYTPHTPATVLANRRGDCKDASQLLAVMLREVGIDVGLVSLGMRGDGQVLESVPSPWSTHGILLATIAGKHHWIDTTATLAAWDFLPLSDRDRFCYVTDERGIRLMRTPPLTPEDNRIEQTTHLWVAPDGSSRSVRTSVYHGQLATSQRDRWHEVPAGERRRLTATRLLDSNSRTRLCDLTIEEESLRDFDQPVTGRVEFVIPDHFRGSKNPEGSFTDPRVWNYLLGYNLAHDRKVALELWGPVETRHRYLVHAPAGFEFERVPSDQVIQSRWGVFTRLARWVGEDYRTVQIDFRLRLDKVRVQPADFAAFRKFHQEVYRTYRVWLSLERVYHLRHAGELEAMLALLPADRESAATLAQLYLHHKRYDDARRVLTRARFYRPDDATLLELTLKAAETRKEMEKAQRELAQRFPKEPNYAILLAASLIDRDKHTLATPLLKAWVKAGQPPVRSLASYHLGRSCWKQNRLEEALKHLALAAQDADTKQHKVAVYLLQGQVFEKLSLAEKAAGAYRQALRVDADSQEVLSALIRLLLREKKQPEALDYLRRYTVLVGDGLAGLIQAADFHLRLGRYEDALDLATRAARQRFHGGAERVLGLVHLAQGDYEKAVLHLEQADPFDVVLEGLLRAHVMVGNLREAERGASLADLVPRPTEGLQEASKLVRTLVKRRRVLLDHLKVKPEEKEKWLPAVDCFVCADHAYRAGVSAERVEKLLGNAASGGVDLGSIQGLRGVLHLKRGQLSSALRAAERAITLTPWDARGWYVRGRVRLERREKGALEDLQKAAELSQRKDADILKALEEAHKLQERSGAR